jgi:hypothetical protein
MRLEAQMAELIPALTRLRENGFDLEAELTNLAPQPSELRDRGLVILDYELFSEESGTGWLEELAAGISENERVIVFTNPKLFPEKTRAQLRALVKAAGVKQIILPEESYLQGVSSLQGFVEGPLARVTRGAWRKGEPILQIWEDPASRQVFGSKGLALSREGLELARSEARPVVVSREKLTAGNIQVMSVAEFAIRSALAEERVRTAA